MNKEKGSGRHFIQEESDTKVVNVGEPDSINYLDTFKFDFPNQTEFLEMQFCGDMFQTMSKVVNLLKRSTNKDDLLLNLEFFGPGIAKIFYKIKLFVMNSLEGMIINTKQQDRYLPHRQEQIAKVGLLGLFFEFLGHIQADANTETERAHEYYQKLSESLVFSISSVRRYNNCLNLLFDTLHDVVINNCDNQVISNQHLFLLQSFIHIDNLPTLLIAIFKDEQFQSDNYEIHQEVLYKRVFECKRFPPVVRFFIKKFLKDPKHKYIYVLRKLCVIDDNPMPINQIAVFNSVYGPDVPKGEHRLDVQYDLEDDLIRFIFYRRNGSSFDAGIRELK